MVELILELTVGLDNVGVVQGVQGCEFGVDLLLELVFANLGF